MRARGEPGSSIGAARRSTVLLVVVGLLVAVAVGLVAGVLAAVVAAGAVALGVALGQASVELRDRHDRAEVADALDTSERRFRSLAGAAPFGIVEIDVDGRLVSTNERWRAMTHDAAVEGDDVWAVVHADDRSAMAGRWRKALRSGEEFRARFRLVASPEHGSPNDAVRWVVGQTAPMRDGKGRVIGHVGVGLEVTDLVEARQNLLRFEAIIETTSDFIGITDGQGRPLFMNGAARTALGIPGDADIDELDIAQLYTPASWQTIQDEALPSVVERGVWQGELKLQRPDRGTIPISNVLLGHRASDGRIDFVASVARDTSDQKKLESRLQYQADHDELTGLPNRAPFLAWLGEALEHRDRFGSGVAVLFTDIDRFKLVNDSLGHDAGDQLLVAMGRRVVSATRPHDRIARFGGDEFVIICNGVDDLIEASEVADRLRREVGGRFALGEQEVFVTVSIGVAVASGDQGPEELLRDADAAMYEAKAQGRDRIQVFDASVRARVVERLDVERELRYALQREELVLDFQPIIDLPSGQISGVEALLRWNHPVRGLLLPHQFLRVAEESGLIIEVGRWVLTRACEVAQRLLIDPVTGEGLPLFVNLSARQLVDVDLVPTVREVIDLTGVDPASVHFEITEDALMADAATTSSTLSALRELGVRLALDDFGTGHSSLAYLKQFPVETLKIDRTFIEGLGRDAGDRAITAAIINVARMLGLSTVAEGVERADQAAELAALGCDRAQGYHFARPMDETRLAELLPPITNP